MCHVRPRGRPRQRSKDIIEEDTQEIAITNCRKTIKNKKERKRTLSAANGP